MKSGHTAGIVAGVITGIGSVIVGGIIAQSYLFELPMSTILELLPFTAVTHIGFNLVYGVIFGILFAKFYDVIPGKSGLKKGLFWGLIYAIFAEWWASSHYFAHGTFPFGLMYFIYGIIVITCYGPPLGYLYEGTQQPVKPEDTRKHKPVASVIAGLVGGIVGAILFLISLSMGVLFGWYYPPRILSTTLITNVTAIEFILMLVWGIIFGIIFVLLYARLPGKNVMKGLYYGLIVTLLSIIYVIMWGLAYAANLQMIFASVIILGLAFISYGIVLGYFYKKE